MIYATCASAFGDQFTKGVYFGKPACGAADSEKACQLVTGTCQLAADIEAEIEKWPITSNDSIANYMKDQSVVIDGHFATSRYNHTDDRDAWLIGSWPTASTPQFDKYYIGLRPEMNNSASKVQDYKSFAVRFAVKRNDNGPKHVQVAFYHFGNLVETSEVFDVSTTFTDIRAEVKDRAAFDNNLTIRVTGFDAATNNGGTLSIADMALYGVKK